MRALWGIAVCAQATIASAGPCKYHHDWSLAPVLLTPSGATIDQRGGVVVAAVSTRDQTRGSEDPTRQDWWFSDGKAHSLVARTVIAPGLTVHRPRVEAKDLALVYPADGRTMLDIHFRHADQAAPLAAPRVKSVTYADHDLGIMVREQTRVVVESVPAHAVALVIYVGDAARSWVQTNASATDLAVYVRNDCTMTISGAAATKKGETATVAWLDDTGHLSPRSAAVVVR